MIQIVVLIKVTDHTKFIKYESVALGIAKQYGGLLLSAFKPSASKSKGEEIDEIHILQFPSLETFEKFRVDPALVALKSLRDEAISSTSLYLSDCFINYESYT